MGKRLEKGLEYAEKGLVTGVVPPVGATLFLKRTSDKFITFLLTSLLSLSVTPRVVDALSPKKIGGNLEVACSTAGALNRIYSCVELSLSPTAFFLDHRNYKTTLTVEGKNYDIWSKNTVKFRNGKYLLRFNHNTRFGNHGTYRVADAERRVRSCERLVKWAVDNDHSKLARKHYQSQKKAENVLLGVMVEYKQIRAAYQKVVDQMNAQLVGSSV